MTLTLMNWLVKRYPTAKRETLRQMVRDGRVTVNGVRPRAIKLDIGPDDQVSVTDRPGKPAAPVRLPYRIVHEDADILVVDKPAGLLTSTVPGERRATLLAAVQAYVLAREPRARVGLIHRLDRDASGLLVFSKSDRAYQSLKTQFFHHTVERMYLAVTAGKPTPASGRIESRLEERADGSVYTVQSATKGQQAITHYEMVESAAGKALLRVRLETGRKHQIRVHLAERKTPIVGDAMYGEEGDSSRLMLAAVLLAFDHPRDGKRVSYEIRTPKGFGMKK